MLCIISWHPICFSSQLWAHSMYKVIKVLLWMLFCLQLATLSSCLWCSAADYVQNETPWNWTWAILAKDLFLNLRVSYKKGLVSVYKLHVLLKESVYSSRKDI